MMQLSLIMAGLVGPVLTMQLSKKSYLQLNNSQGKRLGSSSPLQGVLHHIGSCSQCGYADWCDAGLWKEQFASINPSDYSVGVALADWGCGNVGSSPEIVYDTTAQAIYAVEKPTINPISSCSSCDGTAEIGSAVDWCQSNQWSLNEANVESGYVVDSATAEAYGCDNFSPPQAVRNLASGSIYLVQPISAGVLHHVGSCDQCGRQLCDTFAMENGYIEQLYTMGDPIASWGCSNIPSAPTIVHNSDSGTVYVVGKTPVPTAAPTPAPTESCTDCTGLTAASDEGNTLNKESESQAYKSFCYRRNGEIIPDATDPSPSETCAQYYAELVGSTDRYLCVYDDVAKRCKASSAMCCSF